MPPLIATIAEPLTSIFVAFITIPDEDILMLLPPTFNSIDFLAVMTISLASVDILFLTLSDLLPYLYSFISTFNRSRMIVFN
jgi:hypothetical protein